jgi:guanylate kinase
MIQQPEIYLDDKHWREFTSTHWLVFLDGASGSGKSTFKNLLLADKELGFSYAKRYTTRAPRVDDAENDDYIFVPMDEFLARQENGDLIEYRHFLFGMSYGIGRSTLFESGQRSRSVLAVMNLGGVAKVKAAVPNALCILIDAQIDALELRLRGRGLNTEEQIQERLFNAKEVKHIAGDYDFVFENEEGNIKGSYNKLKSFLLSRRPA